MISEKICIEGVQKLKIVFVSNYLNHHQLPLCKAFLDIKDVEFWFIATEAVSMERRKFGYEDMDSSYGFVIRLYESKEEEKRALKKIEEANVIILSENPKKYVHDMDKMVFIYSERFLRETKSFLSGVLDVLRAIKNHTLHQKKNTFVLCAGAYVAEDFRKIHAYQGRMYKWGYFPEIYEKSLEEAKRLKENEIVKILWVGRFLEWKRPGQILELARELKNRGWNFTIDMIGSGEIEDEIKKKIRQYKLEQVVNMKGSMPAAQVRKYMDEANIFLFTSNKQEGWGAVLNEAMNSRCAIVANQEIGSVPFLLQHGKNGLIYDGTVEDLIVQTEKLLSNITLQMKYGNKAYETVYTEWNAYVAAHNFVQLVQRLSAGEKCWKELQGPCGFEG